MLFAKINHDTLKTARFAALSELFMTMNPWRAKWVSLRLGIFRLGRCYPYRGIPLEQTCSDLDTSHE